MLQLIDEFHLKYAVTPLRERIRNEFAKTIALGIGAMLGLILLLILSIAALSYYNRDPRIIVGLSRTTLFFDRIYGCHGGFH